MTNYQTIIFDLDGTLTDSQTGIINSLAYAFKQMGLPMPVQSQLKKFIGPPLSQSFQDFCGLNDIETQKTISYYRQYFADKGWKENQLLPGARELLAKLKQAGKTLLVASSKPEVFVKQILDHFEIDSYFTVIAGASLDDSRSQKSAVIAHALKTAKIEELKGCVMVGDRKHDVEGAKVQGLPTIGLLLGFGSRQELEESGAIAIAENFQDLEKILLN
ncbi:HAD family hydrolase [Streptococcus sobrinus]|uniref:HAD hydrolase, family IA, variant 1 n=1 Tax=Streptococcus sobrinus W1703 TaxID=1227275 RepID=U2J2D9_9STRE|nr:HAD family hydrolase [Streptococcus sobrinus]AWN61352.1 HAD family hydrolase [Streptococcus sobrinus]AWN63225.1 HAD family hydrolase [Streptococcus sobrinus]ERJ74212.1 HAD hydrolase, family IA, variant 1 [Streptococcus sobrinus W1703]SQG19568.1 phosphatase [Streptococcus sobrinus]